MRAKTSRSYKKTMHSYCIGFGFRTPYQLLLDSTFIKLAMEQRLVLQEELQTVLSNPTRPMVTECTIQELLKRGEHRAASIAKKFERRNCRHHHALSSAKCVLNLIGPKNDYNYCVATQDDDVRHQLHEIPGVPILRVKNGMVILEPLTKVTKEAIQQKEKAKTLPTSSEAQHLKLAKILQQDEKITPAEPVHKKRKAKGVNPLSMKKKKKQAPPPPKKKTKPTTEKL